MGPGGRSVELPKASKTVGKERGNEKQKSPYKKKIQEKKRIKPATIEKCPFVFLKKKKSGKSRKKIGKEGCKEGKAARGNTQSIWF